MKIDEWIVREVIDTLHQANISQPSGLMTMIVIPLVPKEEMII